MMEEASNPSLAHVALSKVSYGFHDDFDSSSIARIFGGGKRSIYTKCSIFPPSVQLFGRSTIAGSSTRFLETNSSFPQFQKTPVVFHQPRSLHYDACR